MGDLMIGRGIRRFTDGRLDAVKYL